LISFSGRTAELLLMLPHIPRTVPVIAITAHSHPASCPLLSYNTPDMTMLLPAPLHIDEETSFGLSAPTSSTTVALALGDALALATARNLHTLPGQGPSEVFKGFHPGGAIGAAAAAAAGSAISTPKSSTSSSLSLSLSCPSTNVTSPGLPSLDAPTKLCLDEPAQKDTPTISDYLVPVDAIPTVSAGSSSRSSSISNNNNNQIPSSVRLLDILLTAIQHPPAKSWVRLSPTEIIPPRRVRSLVTNTSTTSNNTPRDVNINVDTPLCELAEPASIPAEQWLPVRASSSVDDVRMWIEQAVNNKSASSMTLPSFDTVDDVVVSVVDDMDEDKIVGFVSAEEIWSVSMDL
jgi:hypothetical protein